LGGAFPTGGDALKGRSGTPFARHRRTGRSSGKKGSSPLAGKWEKKEKRKDPPHHNKLGGPFLGGDNESTRKKRRKSSRGVILGSNGAVILLMVKGKWIRWEREGGERKPEYQSNRTDRNLRTT